MTSEYPGKTRLRMQKQISKTAILKENENEVQA